MSSLFAKVRPALALAGFLGALFAPPWVPLLMMGLLALRYRAWEVPCIGLLVDFLWLPSGSPFVHIPFFTLAGIFIVWGLEPLRSEFLVPDRV